MPIDPSIILQGLGQQRQPFGLQLLALGQQLQEMNTDRERTALLRSEHELKLADLEDKRAGRLALRSYLAPAAPDWTNPDTGQIVPGTGSTGRGLAALGGDTPPDVTPLLLAGQGDAANAITNQWKAKQEAKTAQRKNHMDDIHQLGATAYDAWKRFEKDPSGLKQWWSQARPALLKSYSTLTEDDLPVDVTPEWFRDRAHDAMTISEQQAAEKAERDARKSQVETLGAGLPEGMMWPDANNPGVGTPIPVPGYLDMRSQIAAAGRPSTTVSVNTATKPLYEELGKGTAKGVLDSADGARSAVRQIAAMQPARELLKRGVFTGTGAEFRQNVARGLKTIGLSNDERVENTDAFVATMAQQTFGLVKQLGSGAGISNADREFAEKAAGGSISMDGDAIKRLMDINERVARGAITQHNERIKPILGDPDVPESVKASLRVDLPEVPASAAPSGADDPLGIRPMLK